VQKVNSLSYCAQAILSEFERFQESSVGKHEHGESVSARDQAERENLAEMMERTYGQLIQVSERVHREGLSVAEDFFTSIAQTMQSMKQEVVASTHLDFEQLEMRLSMLEDKILGTLLAVLSDEVLLGLRSEVNQELNRHRRGLKAEHLAMLEKKMMSKKLLERFGVPRLSLFYMPLN
jgi:hypothetical protein